VTQIRPDIGTFNSWRCPTTRSVPIDDPRNSATTLRCSIAYWPYTSYGSSPNAFSSPGNIAQHSSTTAFIQDLCYKWSGKWRSNHCRGGSQREVYNNNPSLKTTFDGLPSGINVLYGDGHVAWTKFGSDLVMVFSPGSSDTYSDKSLRR
jgi:prepilin-type processing-associated H-X9-DG protein